VNAIAEDGTTAVICTRLGEDADLVTFDILCVHGASLTTKDWRGRCILDETNNREECGNTKAMRDILRLHDLDFELIDPASLNLN